MSEIYEFADFRLDVRERVLERRGSGERVALPDKAFDTLCVLVRNAGRLVEKEEILRSVWVDSFVEENNLNKSIHAIRRALGDQNGEPKFVETVKRHGFRFVAEVTVTDRGYPEPTKEAELLGARSAPLGSSVVPMRLPGAHPARLAAEPKIDNVQAFPMPAEGNDSESRSNGFRPTIVRPVRRGLSRIATASIFAVAVLVASAGIYLMSRPTGGAADVLRFAVLPLKPIVADGRNTGIEFAVAEALILKLSGSKNFDVKRLNTVRKFVELNADAVEAGRELNVDYVLASNYQIENGRVRVTSQLIHVGTGAVEQTFRSETDSASVFGIQDAVANDIGNAVFARFGRPKSIYASRRGTENEEAYNLYQQAWYLIDKGTADESAKAAGLLDRAVELDPNYAQAWAVRSHAYCQYAHLGGGEPISIFPKAQPMLERAMSLDPDNAMAYAIRGTINRDYHWNFPQSIADLEKSIELDPGIVLTHRILAGVYYREGQFENAIEAQKRAVDLHPTSLVDHTFLGNYLVAAGRTKEGIEQLNRVVEMGGGSLPFVYNSLWRIYSVRGDHTNAFENYMKARRLNNLGDEVLGRYEKAYSSGGWKGVMRTELKRITAIDRLGNYSPTKVYVAQIASQVGESDVAFQYLEDALKFRSIDLSFLKVDPMLADLRNDPRYTDLIRRVGI